MTINSEEELEELLDEYCYDDEGEDETCGEIVYPVTVEAPNGDQFTANSEEEVYTFMEEWYSNNCNTVECDDEFEVVYPITMEFENEQGEIMGSASLHLLQKINRRLGIIEDVVVFKKFRGKMVGFKLIDSHISISRYRYIFRPITANDSDCSPDAYSSFNGW